VLPALLALAVVGASAAGAAALMSDGTPKKAATAAVPPPVRNAAWTLDAAHDAYSLTGLSGAWVTDSVVVRGGVDGLHAVQRKDGSAAWDLPVPTDGGFVCAMSSSGDGGVGVVSFGLKDAKVCTTVSGIELASGHVLWTAQTAAVFERKEADAAAVAIDGGIALLGSPHPASSDAKGLVSVAGLDARSGAVKWKHTTKCDFAYDSFLAAGGETTLIEVCGGAANVVTLNSGSGAQVRSLTSPQLKNDAALVSLAPLAVADAQTHPAVLAFPAAAGATATGATASTPTAMTATPVSGLDFLFSSLTVDGHHLPHAASGGGVLCAAATRATCWDGAGKPLTLRGLPDPAAELLPVTGVAPASPSTTGTATTGKAATRFILLPTHAQPRAALCRVAADGAVVVEEELSLPVSDMLTKGGAQQVTAYGDATDLVLMAVSPSGGTAVIDVR
jgi:hypothetical protein